MRTRPLLPSVCQSPSGESGSAKSCFALAGSAASCGGGGATGVSIGFSTGFSITTVLVGSDFVTGDGADCVVVARSVFVAGGGWGGGGGATVSVAILVAGAVTAGGAAGAG